MGRRGLCMGNNLTFLHLTFLSSRQEYGEAMPEMQQKSGACFTVKQVSSVG